MTLRDRGFQTVNRESHALNVSSFVSLIRNAKYCVHKIMYFWIYNPEIHFVNLVSEIWLGKKLVPVCGHANEMCS